MPGLVSFGHCPSCVSLWPPETKINVLASEYIDDRATILLTAMLASLRPGSEFELSIISCSRLSVGVHDFKIMLLTRIIYLEARKCIICPEELKNALQVLNWIAYMYSNL